MLLFGCSTNKVMTDYDKNVDLTKYKTYGFYEDLGEGLNQFDKNRVEEALDSILTTHIFEPASEPDFLINVIVNYAEVVGGNTINIGFGNVGRRGGVGVSGGIPIGGRKLSEEFIIEFVDAKTDSLFWEGIAITEVSEERTPEVKRIHFVKTVEKILEKYPIKKSSEN